MSPSEEHDDLYSVSPAAMSDEQIARRDAMSIVELADNVAAQSVSLNVLLEQVCRQVERMQRERVEMQTVLRDVLSWPNGLPISIRDRAEKLLAGG